MNNEKTTRTTPETEQPNKELFTALALDIKGHQEVAKNLRRSFSSLKEAVICADFEERQDGAWMDDEYPFIDGLKAGETMVHIDFEDAPSMQDYSEGSTRQSMQEGIEQATAIRLSVSMQETEEDPGAIYLDSKPGDDDVDARFQTGVPLSAEQLVVLAGMFDEFSKQLSE